MLNLLFVFGLVFGIVVAVLVVAAVVSAVVTVVGWLNGAVLSARIDQRPGRDEASALTTPHG
jgi:hypothetical protein